MILVRREHGTRATNTVRCFGRRSQPCATASRPANAASLCNHTPRQPLIGSRPARPDTVCVSLARSKGGRDGARKSPPRLGRLTASSRHAPAGACPPRRQRGAAHGRPRDAHDALSGLQKGTQVVALGQKQAPPPPPSSPSPVHDPPTVARHRTRTGDWLPRQAMLLRWERAPPKDALKAGPYSTNRWGVGGLGGGGKGGAGKGGGAVPWKACHSRSGCKRVRACACS